MSERACLECGAPLVRARKSSDADWLRKRYCSSSCAASFVGQGNAFVFDDAANALASEILNERMWAVYQRRARQQGLSNPLEVAVQLGMAA